MSDMIKLSGLWRKEKDGSVYYTGKLGPGAQLLVFKNRYREKDTDPDLILYVAKLEKRDGADRKEDRDAF